MTLNHHLALGLTLIIAYTAPADRICVETLPPLPTVISNNAVTSVDNEDGTTTLYSFMGIVDPTSFNTITAAAYRLDWPGGTWTGIADVPLLNGKARIAANAITVDGVVYLLGGYTVGGGEVTDPRLFVYDPDADVYIEKAEVPTEVDDTVVGVYQDRWIYLVSGWHGPFNNNVRNVQVYDTHADVWAQATITPTVGLFGHSGSVIGDRVMYMDGARATSGFPITDFLVVGQIDPDGDGSVTTIAWEQLDPHPGLPTYRAAPSQVATPDGRMLLVGGTDNTYNFTGTGYNGQPSNPLAQVLAFDPVAQTWEQLDVYGPHIPTMDHRGLIAIGDGWGTIGGMTGPGAATDAVYLFALVADQPGDINCDHAVTFADLLLILGNWGPCGPQPSWCSADLDDSGAVDFQDVLVVLQNWS